MATNTIHVSGELLAKLRSKAAAEGKTVDELAEDALQKGLEDRQWQDLLAYGHETGRASGYAEADVPGIVTSRRRIRHKGADRPTSPSIEASSLVLGEGSFHPGAGLAELAEAQKVIRMRNPSVLAGAVPADQDVDEFLEVIYGARK